MACGWYALGGMIVLGESGHLLDGQHRLAAIVQTGITAELVVAQGAQREILSVIDTGRPRTATDWLRMQGHDRPGARASAAKLILGMQQTGSFKEGKAIKFPFELIASYATDNEHGLTAAIELGYGARLALGGKLSAGTAVLAACLACRADVAGAEFMESLRANDGSSGARLVWQYAIGRQGEKLSKQPHGLQLLWLGFRTQMESLDGCEDVHLRKAAQLEDRNGIV